MRLVHLKIGGSWFAGAAARTFAGSFRLPALRSLDLSQSPNMGEAGVQALVDGGVLDNLRKLRLVECRSFGKGGLRTLASRPALARLEHLDVRGNLLSTAAAESLAASPFLTNLTTLVLDANAVGDAGAAALASSPLLKRLTCLSLRRRQLSDRGLQALARSAHLGDLTVLDLGENNRVGDGGVEALLESPHLDELAALDLWGGNNLPEGPDRRSPYCDAGRARLTSAGRRKDRAGEWFLGRPGTGVSRVTGVSLVFCWEAEAA